MQGTTHKEIIFNRSTGQLTAPTAKLLMQARLMQMSMLALAPFGHLGISRVHGAINHVLKPRTFTSVVEGQSTFRYPSDDYYWNRLLTASWKYEPEIDQFLKSVAEKPFVFLDLGANFGFWSERVGAGVYGSHQAIAVEASEASLRVLELNVGAFSPTVKVIHAAIEAISGKTIPIFGERHAGVSIKNDWPGASSKVANTVETISVDDLLQQENVNAQTLPVVIKLDIEGAELLALQGARQTIVGRSIFLMEDAEPNDISDAVRYAHDDCQMKLFTLDASGVKLVTTLDDIKEEKAKFASIGQVGFNLLATASEFWQDTMSQLNPKTTHSA